MNFLHMYDDMFKGNVEMTVGTRLPNKGKRNTIYQVVEYDLEAMFKMPAGHNPLPGNMKFGVYYVKPQINRSGYKGYYYPDSDGDIMTAFEGKGSYYSIEEGDTFFDKFRPITVTNWFENGEDDSRLEYAGGWNDADDRYDGPNIDEADIMITNDPDNPEDPDGYKIYMNPRLCSDFKRHKGLYYYTWTTNSWIRLDQSMQKVTLSYYNYLAFSDLLDNKTNYLVVEDCYNDVLT